MRQLDHVMAIHPDFEPVASRYEALGFQLTEISHHPMGTGNRLMIFASNFMEILAVTRPELIARDTTDVVGDYLSARTGITGIAVRSESQQQDLTAFAASDVPGVGGFSFQRPVSLPDGRDGMADVDVVVSRNAATPLVFYFTSHQKRPEAIWQPSWQQHPNGAQDIVEVVCVETAGLDALADYQAKVLGISALRETSAGKVGDVALGYALSVLTPAQLEQRYAWARLTAEPHAAYVAGLVIRCGALDVVREAVRRHDIPATCRQHEVFISPRWTDGSFLHLVAAEGG